MFFSSIRKLFAANKSPAQGTATSNPVALPETRPLEDYFQDVVCSSPFIKPDARTVVMRHLTGAAPILRTGNNLTAQEKKALGINARLAITKELVSVLTNEGIAHHYPAGIIDNISNKASIEKSRDDNFKQALKSGIKKFTLEPSGDGSECEWCAAHLGIEFGTDILERMKANCTCDPYSKCFFYPIIDFDNIGRSD